VPAILTGKPLVLGGSAGRLEATGRGVVLMIREALRTYGLERSEATVAIQGCGNVGGTAARLLHARGFRIVAVNDAAGGAYNPKGLDIPRLIAHRQATGTVGGFEGSRPIDSEELLTLDVDVLIPAALENQITSEIARRVRARLIAEAANGPTTSEADRILERRGIPVVPDILCNAGGVTASYFEWVQNMNNFYWTEEEVNDRLEAKMVAAFQSAVMVQQARGVTLRDAAYMLAVQRLAEGMEERGWLDDFYRVIPVERAEPRAPMRGGLS
ncbi:MAG TPA: glutamate dehydrogenase, partial [Limnochordia bacterium]